VPRLAAARFEALHSLHRKADRHCAFNAFAISLASPGPLQIKPV
jgi:hypothetical protein